MNRHPVALAALLVMVGAGTDLFAAQPPATKPATKSPAVPSEHPQAPRGQEVDLRPKFTAGKLTRYEMTMTSGNKIKSDQEDLNQDQTMMQSIGLSMRVKSVDDDGATVELVYDRIKASLDMGDTKASFDSSSPKAKPGSNPPAPTTTKPTKTTPAPKPAPTPKTKPGSKTPATTPANAPSKSGTDPDMSELLSQIMGPMVGTTLTMKVDKDGNIKSVSGGDALTGAGATSGLLGGLGGAGGGLGGGMSLPVPQAGGSASNPMSWIVNSPGQKSVVRVGESWTNTDSLGGTPVGGFKMVTKHTCRSVSETSGGKTANLVFSGRADQASEGQPDSASGFTLKDTTYNGDYAWDMVKGELKSLNSVLQAAIDGKVAGFSMSMSSNTKIAVKRLD